MSYTERLQREQEAVHRLRRRSLRSPFHSRRRCKHALLAPEDPDALWRCCPRWHEKLTNKFNSRAFAIRHGCRVPRLFWHGTDVDALPFATLPPAYVVRPAWGTASCAGICVMHGHRDLMADRDRSLDELRAALRATTAARGRYGERVPLLVEEFIESGDDAPVLPIEHKLYVFDETVALIAVNHRLRRGRLEEGAFLPDWTPIPGGLFTEANPLSVAVPRPPCLDEMLAQASRLGRAIGRHVRLDFYCGPAGAVFGELTFNPSGGRGYNAFAEAYLGEQWDRAYPDDATPCR